MKMLLPRSWFLPLALVGATPLVAARPADQVVVSAGSDRALIPPATSVTLAGRLETDRRLLPNEVSISWAQISGPPVQIQGAHTLTPTIVPSHAGSVLLRLDVRSPRIGIRTDDVWVYVFGDEEDAVLSGEARKWQKVSLTFTHDVVLSETSSPNPFLDIRLLVYFLHPDSGAVRAVPGFFAADGNAAETSATAGTKWRVNFTPDRVGRWFYLTSFRQGPGVALSQQRAPGVALPLDNANGGFFVEPVDPNAPGFLSKGRLEYVDGHHLRFAETHEHFLKGGAGSPENFFGYYEFDGTTDQGGESNGLSLFAPFDGLHHYNPHLGDYVDLGVPLWKNGKGRRIFGAINYLASRGVNSLYALSYNIDGGDGSEVWPWSTPSDRLYFDVSKLEQWERVVDHMTRAGIAWHVVTQETENNHVLDGGELGVERKLYYRELVARFGHALGLVWNLGEENTNTPDQRRAFADYLRSIDPYDHPISLHNVVGDLAGTFGTLLGTHLELVSLQGDPLMTPPRARQLVLDSEAAGRPWVVNFDEQTPAGDGVVPDSADFWHDYIRRESLWPMLIGQGGGCEWYFGYAFPNDDLDCEDFRSRENLWQLTTRAIEFLRTHVPIAEMEHADPLAEGNDPSVLAKRGAIYLVYLPFGGPATLDLEGSADTFSVRWFDGRDGGALQNGSVPQISGPGVQSLGAPPAPGDWVALVRRTTNFPPEILTIEVEPGPFTANHDFSLAVHATDPNGPSDLLSAWAEIFTPGGALALTVPLAYRGGDLYSIFQPAAAAYVSGGWRARVTVMDAAGASAQGTITFRVK